MNQLAVLERLGELQGKILAQAVKPEAGDLTGFSLSKDEGPLIFEWGGYGRAGVVPNTYV